MPRKIKVFLIFFQLIYCLSILFFSTQSFAYSTYDLVQARQIQLLLDNWRARSGIPGATLSIYLPDKNFPMTYVSGRTTISGQERIGEDSLFQAGSITKSFTATIILQLEALGKLHLDDPITEYLPQFPQWQNITIRQLLNHTSGIFNYTETGTFHQIRKLNPEAEFTPEQIIHMASAHHSYFAPGRGWKYSNTNYVLAGMIIETVTGKPIADVMDEYLHGGMRVNLINTYYLPRFYPAQVMAHMAHGYSGQGIDVTTDNMSWAGSAGAIVTTTQDLLNWWRALFEGSLLPDAQLKEMMDLVCTGHAPGCKPGEPIAHLQAHDANKGYGLGVAQTAFGSERIGTVWWHNGSTAGYKAIVMWFPQNKIYLALTINRDPGYLLKPDLPIFRGILNALIPAAQWSIQHSHPKHKPLNTVRKKVKQLQQNIKHHHKQHAKS